MASDPMPLDGIDHVELYVGNARQAAFYWSRALGFRTVAYAGLESGVRDRASYVLAQGDVRVVVTAALGSGSSIAEHQRRHGDGVRGIALAVPSAKAAWDHATAHGAAPVAGPEEHRDEHGVVRTATVGAYGDTVHTFVERGAYAGPFLPGYVAVEDPVGEAGLFDGVDHIVANVELGRMDEWVAYYRDVLGMRELSHFTDEAISTEYSALMSKVVGDGGGKVLFPINEPAEGRRRSQVDEYLEFYESAGAQHLALTTPDIVATVAALRGRGVELLEIPGSYFDDLPARVPEVGERLAALRRHGILVDRDQDGHLLQAFMRPLGDRPTLFVEVIERQGARGFGNGNFKALFEALEREQDRRGNL